jgi:hypothetical protein
MNIKQHHQPYIIVIKLATSKLRPSNNNHARNNTHITLLHYSIPFSRSNSRGRSSISRAGAAAIAGVGAASAGQEHVIVTRVAAGGRRFLDFWRKQQ